MQSIRTTVCVCVWAGIVINVWGGTMPAPSGLTCEFLRDPASAVVTDDTPEFSWFFPQVGNQQQAYRILVATQPHLLKEGAVDAWDSGKVASATSINVSYDGKPLRVNSTYWWQVKVWSTEGVESPYGAPQQFNIGDFNRSQLDYPGQSRWVELTEDFWVAEDKQRAAFAYIDPVAFVDAGPGVYFIGFEKSVIGILEFSATASTDNLSITIHLGERKDGDFSVHKQPGRTNIGYEKVEMKLRQGTHHYVVKLAERPPSHYLHSQKMAPHLPEVLPFRYVEVSGPVGEYRIDKVKQAALFYYFDEQASAFDCDDATLKEVWDLCKYTLKATPFLGVYADGNRERMPYEADAYIQQLGHYSVDREYAIGKYTINFLLNHASWPTEWQMHMPMMAWQDYMYTGDAGLLAARYEDLRRKTLITLAEDNGLISTRKGKVTQELLDKLYYPGELKKFRDIVDWPQGRKQKGTIQMKLSPLAAGETDGYEFTDLNTVVNAFHFHNLEIMARIARILNKKDEANFFTKRAAQHHRAFMATFFDPKRGVFKDGDTTDHASLHANMFPLAFGLVPAEHRDTVLAFVKSRGMACSVYGAHYLLEGLFLAGEPDYALDLMTAKHKRSWMNMLQVGSTMTTEAWDEYYKGNLTWNHAWGSAPANAVARRLVGIEPLAPGFKHFRVAPQPGRLRQVSFKQSCIRGPIAVDLIQQYDQWRLAVSVPGNCMAELWIPKRLKVIQHNGVQAKIARTDDYAHQAWQVILLEPGIHAVLAHP